MKRLTKILIILSPLQCAPFSPNVDADQNSSTADLEQRLNTLEKQLKISEKKSAKRISGLKN